MLKKKIIKNKMYKINRKISKNLYLPLSTFGHFDGLVPDELFYKIKFYTFIPSFNFKRLMQRL